MLDGTELQEHFWLEWLDSVQKRRCGLIPSEVGGVEGLSGWDVVCLGNI